jgi:hypothetical protein
MVLWNVCKHIPDYTASPPSMQDFHSSICSQFCNSFALNRLLKTSRFTDTTSSPVVQLSYETSKWQLSYETSKWQTVVSTTSVALAVTPLRLHDHAPHCAPRRFLIKLCGPRFYSTLYYARYKPSKILPNSNCCIQAPASSTAFSSLSWYYFFIKYFWQKNGAGYI